MEKLHTRSHTKTGNSCGEKSPQNVRQWILSGAIFAKVCWYVVFGMLVACPICGVWTNGFDDLVESA